MKSKHLSVAGLCFAAILALPSLTHAAAYKTTAQTAAAIGTHTALYTITYDFGMSNQAVFMPVLATRGLAWQDGTKSFRVGYQIETASGTPVKTGTTNAMVIAPVPIVGNMYRIPAGHAALLTLVVVAQLPDTVPLGDYRLHVTKLPFIFSDAAQPNDLEELNKYELSQYVTSAVALGIPHIKVTSITTTPANANIMVTVHPVATTTTTTTNQNFHW